MARRRTAPPLAVLFLLLLSTAARPCQAQPSNNTTVTHHSRAAVGGFTPTTVIVLVALVSAFVVLTLFSIYINRCAPTRAHPPRRLPARYYPQDHQTAGAGGGGVHPERRARAGLGREVVESFPTAVYGDVKARVAAKSGPAPPLECAVCLAAFEDRDELRVLPGCCHVFHPDCIDPWLAGAVTCPLCRADLTVTAAPHTPPASSSSSSEACDCDRTAVREEPVDEDEQQDDEDERDEARLVATLTPESVMSFGASHPHEFHYRRTQSAMDVPDRHTLRLPEHVMKELAKVRRHRRAASLAGYPDGASERTPGWLASFWRSVSWQRPSRTDQDAVVDEHGGGNSKRVVPITGAPAETPGGSGAAPTDDKEKKPDHDALNQV